MRTLVIGIVFSSLYLEDEKEYNNFWRNYVVLHSDGCSYFSAVCNGRAGCMENGCHLCDFCPVYVAQLLSN